MLLTLVLADPELMLGQNETDVNFTIPELNGTSVNLINTTLSENETSDGDSVETQEPPLQMSAGIGGCYDELGGGICNAFGNCSCVNLALNDTNCTTVILGESISTTGTCVIFPASDKTLDGNGSAITGDGGYGDSGVIALNKHNITIKNLELFYFSYAINIRYCANVNVTNDTVSDSELGLDFWETNDSWASGNNFSYNGFAGLRAYFSINCTIEDNLLNSNDGNGLTVDGGSGHTLHDNTANENLYCGIGLYDESENNTIDANNATLNGYPGIFLNSSDNNNITSNDANENGQEDPNYNNGIYLYNSSHNLIYNNTAEDNEWAGLELWAGSNNNNVTGNTFDWNYDTGIYVEECSNNSITDNTVNDNYWGGIYFYDSFDNNVTGNTINDSYAGIVAFRSDENNISDNDATNGYMGIWLFFSTDNIVGGNNLTGNEIYSLLDSGLGDCNEVNNVSNIGGIGNPILYKHDTSGLTIENTDAYSEILLCNVNGSTIDNVTIANLGLYSDGILLSYSNNNTITRSTLNEDFAGIALYNSEHNNVTYNNATDNGIAGIAVLNFNADLMEEIYNESGGVWFLSDDKENLEWLNPETINAGFEELLGIYNELKEPGAGMGALLGIMVIINPVLLVTSSGDNRVVNNTVNGSMMGIVLISSNDTLINNTVNECMIGIGLYVASEIDLINNTVDLNLMGVYMLMALDNTLDSNEVCYNEAIDILGSTEEEYIFGISNGGYENTGIDNYCNLVDGWNDVGSTGCTHLCTGVSVLKTANVMVADRGDTINWTVVVNNTGIIDVNVTLTDTNGETFNITNLTPGESWNRSYTTTAGYCDIENTIEGGAENIYGLGYNVSESAEVEVSHCGDNRCNCDETCHTCKEDCGSCGGGASGGGSSGYTTLITLPTPPQKPTPQMTVSPDAPELNTDLIVTVTYPDGTPVTGEVLAIAPDGTTMTLILTNGKASLPGSKPGLWRFSYTYEGGTLTASVNVTEKTVQPPAPPKEKPPTGQAITSPKQAPAGNADWIWIVAVVAIVVVALLLLLTKKPIRGKR